MKWFKHDSRANRDSKLEKVLMKYGAEGYALYWLCLELIADPIDKTNLTFELEHDSEVLAYRLKLDSKKVEEMMRFFVQLKLFEFDETTKRVTCLKLASRLENSIIKNPQLKQIQQVISENPGQSRTTSDNPGQTRLDKNRIDNNNINIIHSYIGPSKFIKPTLEEITEYCQLRNNNINPVKFFNYYESIGWKVGKHPMKSWKAAMHNWEINERKRNETSKPLSAIDRVKQANAEWLEPDEPIDITPTTKRKTPG